MFNQNLEVFTKIPPQNICFDKNFFCVISINFYFMFPILIIICRQSRQLINNAFKCTFHVQIYIYIYNFI